MVRIGLMGAVWLLATGAVVAQSPSLLRDIDASATPLRPAGFTDVGDFVCFGASSGVLGPRADGRELWTIHRRTLAPYRVADIVEGARSSSPSGFTRLGSSVVFVARHPSAGPSLFSLRAVPQSPIEIAHLGVSMPIGVEDVVGALATFQGAVYVGALDGLWRTDGTPNGTTLVHAFPRRASGAPVRHLTVHGNELWFAADDGLNGFELWRSDGTGPGTRIVADVRAGSAGSGPSELTGFGNHLVFVADDGLGGRDVWRSDVVTGATSRLIDLAAGLAAEHLSVVGLHLYFAVESELWRSDGTSVGTGPILDVAPGASNASLDGLIPLGNRCVFHVVGGPSGIWASDGTAAGTRPLLATPATSDPSAQVVHQGRLLFAGEPQGGSEGVELWSTDGTPGGTMLVKDIRRGSTGSLPSGFGGSLDDGRILFTADDGTDAAGVWATDGTSAGTTLVTGTFEPISGADGDPDDFVDCLGITYFSADDGVRGRELWRTDGTPTGTWLVADVDPIGNGDVDRLTAAGDRVFFVASTPSTGREIWVTDGTSSGTRVVDVVAGSVGSNPAWLRAAGRNVFFAASDPASGSELWVTDGTLAGTRVLTDTLNPGPALSTHPGDAVALGSKLLFSGTTAATGSEPFVSDGTLAGTLSLGDLWPGATQSRPTEFTVMSDRVVFVATEPNFGRELWETDGTAAGTRLLLDLSPGPSFTAQHSLVRVGDRLFFLAFGRLWVSDLTLTGTRLVNPPLTPIMEAFLRPEVALGDSLLLSIRGVGSSVWTTDGTSAGTVELLREGLTFRYGAPNFVTSGSRYAWFAASDGVGSELWRTDGTVAGTRRVADLWPGTGSSDPADITLAHGRLLMGATHQTLGREPWVVTGIGASTQEIGYGCSSGVPPHLSATDPVLGGSFTIAVEGMPQGALGVLFLSAPSTSVISLLGCDFFLGAGLIDLPPFSATGGSWTATVPLALPLSLTGVTARVQAAIGPTARGIDTTNALAITLGR